MWMSHLIILFLFVFLCFFSNMLYHPLNSSLFGLGKSLKVCWVWFQDAILLGDAKLHVSTVDCTLCSKSMIHVGSCSWGRQRGEKWLMVTYGDGFSRFRSKKSCLPGVLVVFLFSPGRFLQPKKIKCNPINLRFSRSGEEFLYNAYAVSSWNWERVNSWQCKKILFDL